MLKTAIVILNWNGRKYLEQFLPSVLKSSTNSSNKVIVADNGSTDDSIIFLKEKYSTVEIIELSKNWGFAEGYNQALKQIEAEYYIILNSDVEVTENWLDPIIDFMDRYENVAACQPKIRAFNAKHQFEYAGACGGYIDYLGFPFCRGRVLNVLETDNGQYDTIANIFWATGACLVVRSKIFHEAGGFDGDFFAHMEEIDLCWRIKNLGYDICCIPKSTVYHVGGGTLPNNSPRKLYLNFRNNLFLLYKNLPGNVLIKRMFQRMVYDGVAALKFLLSGEFRNSVIVFKAHISFYKNLPKLKVKRRNQANKVSHNEMLKKSMIYSFYLRNKKTFSELIK